jgi:microcystin-dependent protein
MIILPSENEQSPEAIRAANLVTRREVLRRVAFGSGAVLLPGLLAACVDDYNPLAANADGTKAAGDISTMNVSESYLSEIRIVSFANPPQGWARCNGQLLPINQNQALFALLGTTYGGNGQTNFALPDLRGRVPIHFDDTHNLGSAAGSTSVTVNIQQLPTHLHALQASNGPSNASDPTNAVFAEVAAMYGPPSSLAPLLSQTVSSVGGSQPHNNMMPYLTLNFIIALQGIFPSRN